MGQGNLFDAGPAGRKGRWVRTSDGLYGEAVAWRHDSGWWLRHCGHPTAVSPWEVFGPAGERLWCPAGKNFRSVAQARAAIELHLIGEYP